MTAGMPGAGVGGLFYLLNALWMPIREIWLASQGRSSASSRRVVRRQVSIALGILASMWLAARGLTAAFALQPAMRSFAGFDSSVQSREIPGLLSYAAIVGSAFSLAVILIGVQTLRLFVPSRRVLTSSSRRHVGMFLLAIALTGPGIAGAQAPEEASYRAALKENPNDSRTSFLLAGLLERSDPSESERLYRKYITLESGDPWGYIVLAEFLGRSARYSDAIGLYEEALLRAPGERDAAYGRARMLARAGRTEKSIEGFEQWLRSHPADADAWRDLSRQLQRAGRYKSATTALKRADQLVLDGESSERIEYLSRASAPAIKPAFSFARDSDGNTRTRTELGGDFTVRDGVRTGISFSTNRISDLSVEHRFQDFAVHTELRPRATVRINAAGGAVRLSSQLNNNGTGGSVLVPKAMVHIRAASESNATRFDVRVNRTLLDATPLLVDNRIVRTEIQTRPDFGLSRRFRLRGIGGFGRFDGAGESNTRYTGGAGAAWTLRPSLELSGNFTQSNYAHASHVGYFAPEAIQTAEGSSYLEFENEVAVVALDLGAGAQRFKEHGSIVGPWRPAWRSYALVSFRLRSHADLAFELDTYNTQAGPAIAPVSGWRYASASTSFRWRLP